ncbi:LLM class flavin-dependent oxidoreductase [Streptomyces sp. N50]|uniref:LLM class flavin-dependent oxidoreductase n=1 Tax=Streptomyces sp. N50 TaxID=3081765 RepID=UPI002961FB46|nr:LLM class flavin-dependent oxidoreductase [Streptomyces sp. N50]WOX15224.1 LLM class flavin-dependent oxidoreductase [Streptomyces sp. N50]
MDQHSRGRVLVSIVSGLDNLAAYGDTHSDPARRYARTQEFIRLVRRLWTEEDVTFAGERLQGGAPPLDDGRPSTSDGLLRRRVRGPGAGVGG